MRQIPITEARQTLYSLPSAVNGDPFSIVRHGRPILVAMKPEVYAGIQATFCIYSNKNFRDQVRAGVAQLKTGKAAPATEAKKRMGLPASTNNFGMRVTEDVLGMLEKMKDGEVRAAIVEAIGTLGDNPGAWLPLAHELTGLFGVRLSNRRLVVFSVDSERQIRVLGFGVLPAVLADGYEFIHGLAGAV